MTEPTISFRLLETLTTALYEDPIVLFREYVQNSLDAYIIAIRDKSKEFSGFSVDITIDKDNSDIEIRDNGYGIKKEEFHTKMTIIGQSDKKTLGDQIGFRGIGRLSAMPLCKELIFENKPQGIKNRLIFKWKGEKFKEKLNKGEDVDAQMGEITFKSCEDYDGDIDDHYFKVKIHEYEEGIGQILESSDFKDRLCTLLPLRYLPEFEKQDEIKNKYQEFMGRSLDKYSCSVRLGGEELYKPYKDEHILKSGIVFWDLKFPGKAENVQADKIGLLWFTFNPLIETLKGVPSGILVRSKNMLMGDRYALATDASKSRARYVSTFRELAQSLNGVCGEMLIDYENLHDNARRDWFQIDEAFIKLRHIIVEFMLRLHKYKYAASDYVNDKKKEKKIKETFIDALKGLITNYDPDKLIPDINKLKKEKEASQEVFKYADDDIPNQPIAIKRFYERLIGVLYKYFSDKNRRGELIEIRKYLEKILNQDPKS